MFVILYFLLFTIHYILHSPVCNVTIMCRYAPIQSMVPYMAGNSPVIFVSSGRIPAGMRKFVALASSQRSGLTLHRTTVLKCSTPASKSCLSECSSFSPKLQTIERGRLKACLRCSCAAVDGAAKCNSPQTKGQDEAATLSKHMVR